MCLAVPAQIIELLDNQQAVVMLGNLKQVISVSLIEEPQVGDYLIVHVGYALNKLDPEEAQKTLDLLAQCAVAENS